MMIGARTAIRPTLVIAMSLAGTGMAVSSSLHANDVKVGRYSLLSDEPTEAQTDLLATTVIVHFPAQIQTVGESIRYLLRRSGYRLADAVALAPETTDLFALLLPVVHRVVGPMPLRRALETLVGPNFNLVQDPAHRLIAFEPCTPDWRVARDTGPSRISEFSTNGE